MQLEVGSVESWEKDCKVWIVNYEPYDVNCAIRTVMYEFLYGVLKQIMSNETLGVNYVNYDVQAEVL